MSWSAKVVILWSRIWLLFMNENAWCSCYVIYVQNLVFQGEHSFSESTKVCCDAEYDSTLWMKMFDVLAMWFVCNPFFFPGGCRYFQNQHRFASIWLWDPILSHISIWLLLTSTIALDPAYARNSIHSVTHSYMFPVASVASTSSSHQLGTWSD